MRRNQYTLLLSKSTRWLCMAVLMFACVFSQKAAWAQGSTTAALNGTVKDSKGEAVYGANVVAKHEPTGTIFGAYTRADGRYNIPGLRVGGPYTVTVSFIGYKENKEENVTLGLGEDKRIDFKIHEEAVAMEGAIVEAERNPIISSSRTGASKTVTTREIQSLPTISRSFQDFTRLTPQFANTQGGGSNVAGRNSIYNMIQIDGAVNNDLFGLASSGTPGGQAGTQPISMDAIQEFQVVIAPYDVRQGNFTGGGINAITRSGTNKYEASAFYLYRNEDYIGQSFDRQPFSKFLEKTQGFRLGGPIIKDKLFFFVSAEGVTNDQPTNLGISQLGDGGSVEYTGATYAQATRFSAFMDSAYGYKTGGFGVSTVKVPNTKLFGRIDYTISNNHHFTIRHNYVSASQDILRRVTGQSSTSSSTGFRFENGGYIIKNVTNSTVAQLNSTFGKTMYNELTLGMTSIDDHRDIPGGQRFPYVIVRTSANSQIQAGTEQFSRFNYLKQNIFEITDNFTYYMGQHTITGGTHNEFFTFKNSFLPNYDGVWQFNSMAAFEAGTASRYLLTYAIDPATGLPDSTRQPVAKFSVSQLGFYVQDAYAVLPNLNLTLGVRMDVPLISDKPTNNARFDSIYEPVYGVRTDKIGQGHALFSPRLGINWDVFNDKKTQVRGGLGLFTGRPGYVWISNQFSNTGADLGSIDISAAIPNFNGITAGYSNHDPVHQPIAGAAGKSTINVMDKNFKYPQIARFDMAVDHEIGWGTIGTFELTASKNIHEVLFQDISLANPTTTLPDGRVWFKGLRTDGLPTIATTGTGTVAGVTGVTQRLRGDLYNNVILLKNTNIGYQYVISGQVQKSFEHGFFASIAYAYNRAKDANSATSSIALSNFQFNPIQSNPNTPASTTSNWELRHKVIINIAKSFEFAPKWKSNVSLFYIGRSGRPYSVTYNGDVNGDGLTSNDLIYIPKDKNDIILVPASGTDTRTTDQMWVDLNDYLTGDKYLNSHRGQIAKRNGSTEPWVNRFDLKFLQDIPITSKAGQFQFELDVLNVANALNKNWGQSRSIANQDDTPITFVGFQAGTNKPTFSYVKRAAPAFVDGRFSTDSPESRWRFMVGLRYNF
jgi:hypothetical protein